MSAEGNMLCDCMSCIMQRTLERTQRTVNEKEALLRSWQKALEGALAVESGDHRPGGSPCECAVCYVAKAIVEGTKIPPTPIERGGK